MARRRPPSRAVLAWASSTPSDSSQRSAAAQSRKPLGTLSGFFVGKNRVRSQLNGLASSHRPASSGGSVRERTHAQGQSVPICSQLLALLLLGEQRRQVRLSSRVNSKNPGPLKRNWGQIPIIYSSGTEQEPRIRHASDSQRKTRLARRIALQPQAGQPHDFGNGFGAR